MIKIHLSRILGEKRMTQAELARRTGIRPSTVNDIYNELSERLKLEHINRICECLNCPVYELLEYVPNKKKR